MSENGTALAVRHHQAPAVLLDDERVDTLRRTIGRELSSDELALFVAVANRTGLDPFAKQVYALKMQGRMVLHVGIDGYRLIAERSGKYGGQLGPYWAGSDGQWLEVWLSDAPPQAARVGVIRKDWDQPVWSVARLRSYDRGTPIWKSMPDVMLAKAAEANALRKAFPQELAGVPAYRADLDQGEEPEDVEYRQVDRETGVIAGALPAVERVPIEWESIPDEPETPGASADPDSSGSRGVSVQPTDHGAASQPAPNTAESIEDAFARDPTENSHDAPHNTAPPALMAEATELYEKAKAAGVRTSPPHPASTEMGLNSYIAATKRAITAKQGVR